MGMKGSLHPNATITEDIVLAIRSSDESTAELAVRYGLKRDNVSSILSGRSWSHVGGRLQKRQINACGESFPDTELAYMAGLVDGEGTISVSNSRSKVKGRLYENSDTVLQVYNCHLGALGWIRERFGGYIYKVPRASAAWKDSYAWKTSHSNACRVLKLILPFLIIKKQQANLLVEFAATRKHYGSKGVPDDILIFRGELVKELKTLNKRGSDAVAA